MSKLMSFRQFLENTPQEFKNISELKKSSPELEQLNQLLKAHDWFFTYSDSGADWKKGKKEYEKIQVLIKKIGKEGEELFRTYSKKVGMEKKNTIPGKSLSEQIQKVINDHDEHSELFPEMTHNKRNIALGYGDGKVLASEHHFTTGNPYENTTKWTPPKKRSKKNVY